MSKKSPCIETRFTGKQNFQVSFRVDTDDSRFDKQFSTLFKAMCYCSDLKLEHPGVQVNGIREVHITFYSVTTTFE